MSFNMKRIITVFYFLSVVFISGCVDYEMNSRRTISEIIIDGKDDDWQGKVNVVNDGSFAIGIQHDENYIYFCIITTNELRVKQMLMHGIDIWFGTSIGKKYSVRYPLFDREGRREITIQNENLHGRKDAFHEISENHKMFLLINEDNYPLGIYSIDGNSGINLKSSMNKDKFVFELRYALNSGVADNYLNIDDDNEVSIRIVTTDYKGPFDQGIMPGGRDHNERNRNSGPGRIKTGIYSQSYDDIDISIRVNLTD